MLIFPWGCVLLPTRPAASCKVTLEVRKILTHLISDVNTMNLNITWCKITPIMFYLFRVSHAWYLFYFFYKYCSGTFIIHRYLHHHMAVEIRAVKSHDKCWYMTRYNLCVVQIDIPISYYCCSFGPFRWSSAPPCGWLLQIKYAISYKICLDISKLFHY